MKRHVLTLILMLAITAVHAQQSFLINLNTTAADAGKNQIFVQADGYILAGVGKVEDVYKLYLVKTNLNGNILWTNYFDLGFTGHSNCYSSAQDPEGNMYLTLEGSSEAHLIQITPTGEIGWMHLYSADELYQLTYHNSGELIAAGNSEGTIFINRIDPANGNVIAFASGIAIGSEASYPTAIAINDDNSITLSVGHTFLDYSNPKESSLITFPFSLETHSVYDLQYQESQLVNRCTRVIDGEIFGLVHFAQYAFTDSRIWFTKFHPDGTVTMELQKDFLTSVRLYQFIVNNGGQIVSLGESNRSIYPQIMLYCTTTEGDSLWATTVGLPDNSNLPHDIKLAADGGYILAATTGDLNPLLIKTSASGQLTPLGIGYLSTDNFASIYPNPANDKVTVTIHSGTEGIITINDLSGRTCLEAVITGGKTVLNVSDLDSGIYMYRLSTGQCGKILIARK